MENLQKNWKTLSPQQLSKCMGGIKANSPYKKTTGKDFN